MSFEHQFKGYNLGKNGEILNISPHPIFFPPAGVINFSYYAIPFWFVSIRPPGRGSLCSGLCSASGIAGSHQKENVGDLHPHLLYFNRGQKGHVTMKLTDPPH